jgi:predicted glycoside hydrolase/deacetylase ChbG (UPF0249 family)
VNAPREAPPAPGTAQGARPGQPPAPRRWICSADDFAFDAGAVEGILALIERGRVTATSALVDAPLWPTAAAELRAQPEAGRADVGLHLNFTQGFPQRKSPVWPLGELVLRCRFGAVPRSAIRSGIERQLDAFEDAMGRRPDYVDGHQHVHQFALLRDELLGALARRYGRDLPWLRSTRPPPLVRDLKARLIAALGDAQLRRRAQAARIPVSDWLVGVYGFADSAQSYRERLQAWLRAGPEGAVLMCHPSSRPQPGDPIAAARGIEFEVLRSDEFAADLALAGVVLERGSSLLAQAGA